MSNYEADPVLADAVRDFLNAPLSRVEHDTVEEGQQYAAAYWRLADLVAWPNAEPVRALEPSDPPAAAPVPEGEDDRPAEATGRLPETDSEIDAMVAEAKADAGARFRIERTAP